MSFGSTTAGAPQSNGSLAGGALTGTGTVAVSLLTNAGTVSPGSLPGIIDIVGNYSQTPTGVLKLEIGGLLAGTEFDQLNITGNAAFDGTVNLIFTGGFAPLAGQTFDLIPVTSLVSGGFTQTSILNLDSSFQFIAGFDTGVYRLTALTDGVFIPEPSTLTLGTLSLLACGWRRRRRAP